MKHLARPAILLVLAALVSACGSTPPSSYYMLSADAATPPSHDGVLVGVGPIAIPDYLKNRGMILGRDGNRLTISQYDRWAEPLESGITRVMVLNLASLLDTRQVTVFPWRSDTIPEYAVSVGVVQFTARQNDALLVASWTVHRPQTGELVEKSLARHSLPLKSQDPNQVADVYSALLLTLSKDIASAVQRDVENR